MFERRPSPNESPLFTPELIKPLTQKAIEANSEHSLDMEPFIETYGLETVRKDYGEIAVRLKSYMEQKLSPGSKMGFIFESAFLDIGSKNSWFGENSELTHASKYDDLKNGVDLVSTILRPNDSAHHLAIASDLTYSQPSSSAKFNRVANGIHAGNLAEIKYFHSDLLGFTGRLRNVPRTVIGLDVKNLELFLTNWLREPELAQKQFGLTIMNQIAAQSRGFAALAQATHGKSSPAARAYRTTHDVTQEIIERDYQGIEAPEDTITNTIKAASQRLRE